MYQSSALKGLTFRKLDLHVHTPASKCFDDKSVTPEQIVKKARREGLDAIAITDHNTGEWIDKVQKAADKKLAVFPGVEISTTGGERGVHIIALLDPSKGTKDIENLLGKLGIMAHTYGKEDALTTLAPCQVIEIIASHGGLAILAHSNHANGVFGGMKGRQRQEILSHSSLAAAEATDFDKEEMKSGQKRVVDRLDGLHPEFGNVRLAIYQASDNPSSVDGKHSIEGIGSRFTHFKLDEISLEGLRQCFFDPDVRIKQQGEIEAQKFPRISKIEVSQGYLQGKIFEFHPGLNCIVGGKGVGKSLIIEFLRFAFDQASEDESIASDHESKLRKRLENGGRVTVCFRLEGGEQYALTRTFDEDTNPIECVNCNTGEQYQGDLCGLLPILCYSQNEVIKIAEDEEAQLRLIDSFLDLSDQGRELAQLSKQLYENDIKIAKAIRASLDIASLTTELGTIEEQLKTINAQLKNKLFEEMKAHEAKKKSLEERRDLHDKIITFITEKIEEADEELVAPSLDEGEKLDAEISQANKIAMEAIGGLKFSLQAISTKANQYKSSTAKILDQWLPSYEKKKVEYEAMIEQTGKDQKKLETERRKLEKQKQERAADLEKHKRQQGKIDEIKKQRQILLDKFEAIHKQQYEIRKRKFDELTSLSNSKLELTLAYASNREAYRTQLQAFKVGSRLREQDIKKITENIPARELIELTLKGDANLFASKANISKENALKLVQTLQNMDAFEDILAIPYKCYPSDIPSIKFRKDDGNYYPLSELSVGQKCNALLIIALSEGNRPVIIDQPEDSLDNPSIYEDIVTKLRSGKDSRQFIVTTHNSNVGVASDSDTFFVLKGSANACEVECTGAIDRQQVRVEILRHLEGGQDTYNLKRKKYNQ